MVSKFSTLAIRNSGSASCQIHGLDILLNGVEPPGIRSVSFHTSIDGRNVVQFECLVDDVEIDAATMLDLQVVLARRQFRHAWFPRLLARLGLLRINVEAKEK